MSLSFRNRIAFHYMIATAIIMAIAFGAIYFIVHKTVYSNLDNDLSYEAHKHTGEIKIMGDTIVFRNKAEWEEKEHRESQVNPVFIQLIDDKGRVMDKSPNLKEDDLAFNNLIFGGHFNASLNSRAIRQVQLPLEQDGQTKGYILAAMSSESAKSIILKLRNVLFISFLVILSGLYFISRYLAGRSIRPIKNVTHTIKKITELNLKERVALPPNKDEIYRLSSGFNALLDRIENALEREKQFTSDASHELRTPLASLRGTLEVLIRKPRTQAEYEDKIQFSLGEIERMTLTLEQLLLLARLDIQDNSKKDKLISLPTIIDESLSHFKSQIAAKNLAVLFDFEQDQKLLVPHFYTHLMIENILSNAVKYSTNNGKLAIHCGKSADKVVCSIRDEGIGINEKDLEHIYENFFRSDALNHKQISGNGLGLSIVKKCAEAIRAKLNIISTLGQGTEVKITF
ncbi:HAMP domain-containing protein [Cryomorpha ignava]|uniref:histidine kinase n=1 Tax=Cryomorpha ignava TaxID=101383 RepID=A0A7K3WVG8_9FLAO|nr:ATP-binding protein [Cryomorpha ignava]NEN25041.1 HAMP domain-containing protein [Cryomorpha ignava]